jgi:predicted alpha/beta-fold hydrolase
VLTDVVDERIEPYIGDSEPIILEPMTPEAELTDAAPVLATGITMAPVDLAERLVTLDTAISRLIEDWVANELPQLVSRELDDLAERLRVKASAHLRATLQPLISAEIANTLDDDAEA